VEGAFSSCKTLFRAKYFVFFSKCAAINIKKYEGRMLDCSKEQINNGCFISDLNDFEICAFDFGD
jgi:hypothetical protein